MRSDHANFIYEQLLYGISWQRSGGRDVYYFGDKPYSYGRTTHTPNVIWHPLLAQLRDSLNSKFNFDFNYVLINLYRNHSNGIPWHSDHEPELGPEASIASISFGVERQFCFREIAHRSNAKTLLLLPGSLLIMTRHTQDFWEHHLPPARVTSGSRINLTFRKMLC